MAIGRISGPLLKANLLREGVNLAFENDLLYLDVNNSRIGINTDTPQYDLDVNGTTRAPGLEVSTEAQIASVNFQGNTISTTDDVLTLGTADNVIYQNKLVIDSIDIENNVISTNASNENLELNPNGTGTVEVFGNTNVYGNIVASGSITADGNITIGDANTDNVTFNAEIASNIIPDANNTYTLGSDPNAGGKQWQDVYTQNFFAGTVTTTALEVDGVDLALRQGNIYYVAENGDDAYSGDHPNDPYGSLSYALSQASAGDTIHIYPGEYTEIFPMTVPVGVTVKGHSIRSVKIVPTTETRYNDAFLMNGESTVEDVTIAGFFSGGNYFTTTAASAGSLTINVGTAPFAHAYVDSGTVNISGIDYAVSNATYNHSTGVVTITHAGGDAGVGTSVFVSGLVFSCNGGNKTFPDNGYAFRFATDFEVTSRSPYIRNITVLTSGSVTSSEDPRGFDAGDAGKGAYVDGAYATANSREAGMLFHSVTFITPGVDALSITNGARVEWLNSFTYFADKGLYAFDSNDGIKGSGQTAVRVDGVTGSFSDGETVTYYDTDGVTVLETGTINGLDADGKFYIDGKQSGFETFSERLGKTIQVFNEARVDTDFSKFGGSSLELDGTGDYLKIESQNDFGFGASPRVPKTITVNGDAAASAAQEKFGSGSVVFDGTGDYLSVATTTDFGFETDDFTIEGWFRWSDVSGTQWLFDTRAGAAGDTAVSVATVADGATLRMYVGSSFVINGTGANLNNNVWYHIAVARDNGSTKLFLDGTQIGSTYSDPNNYGSTKPLTIGSIYDGSATSFIGYADELRVTKGEARYTGTFTAPTSAFVDDETTVLLIHGNGTIADDASDFTTGDFTIETWFYKASNTGTETLLDFRAGVSSDNAVTIGIAGLKPYIYTSGAYKIQAAGDITTGQWNHLAYVRRRYTSTLYINGTSVGSWTDTTDYGTTKPLVIGAVYTGTAGYYTGWLDELRISTTSRYTSNFAVPASAFNSDVDTVLLTHFDGADSSVVITDDSQVAQDIRFSGGATAKYITLADFTDFGGEIRSIASACVYGNYGAYGDGPGVLMYLISQNFAYIGTGKQDDNDITDVIQDNEVTELNDAKVRYSSVDHKGDFRVGDLFYVNQETGEVNFTSSELNIETSSGISITTNGSTTSITGEYIDTGNLRFSENTVSSTSGDIIFDAESGTVRINSTGAIKLPSGTTAERPSIAEEGMIRYNEDTNLFEGYDGNWIALNGVYDLDLDTYITAELTPGANDGVIRLYIQGTERVSIDADKLETPRIEVDDISIDGNVIRTETTDTDLVLSAAGAGEVVIDDIAIKDSTITNRAADSVLYLSQEGNGYFKIAGSSGFVVPVGDSLQRPAAAYRETGMTRFNTQQGYLEIWDGNSWVSVAGATGAITVNAAEDLAIQYILTLG